jgi:hypothetical protein
MRTRPRRLAAILAGSAVLTSGAAVAALDSARAADPFVSVAWSAPSAGVDVLLSAQATFGVAKTEDSSRVCGDAINLALQAELPFPDPLRVACGSAVRVCVNDAVRVRGNALSGVRLYTGRNPQFPVGTYRCLVR